LSDPKFISYRESHPDQERLLHDYSKTWIRAAARLPAKKVHSMVLWLEPKRAIQWILWFDGFQLYDLRRLPASG
jgi:hypothetical protein